ncbi:hypothetical protein Tco_1104474 [Tanacetum coccineum]
MFEEKVETPTDSPPITAIDPDDQPTWSSTRTIAPTPSFSIIQRPISNNFRIKGTHMQMIWEIQFDGQIRSDPHRHIADFLEISNLVQYGENQEESVMLRTFPFSLSGEAKTWLNELDEGNITTWNEMREDFGDVEFIKENEIKDIPIISNSSLINSNPPTVLPFLMDCIVHIPYTNAKMLADDVLLNQVSDEELYESDGIGNRVLTKKEIKRNDLTCQRNPTKNES